MIELCAVAAFDPAGAMQFARLAQLPGPPVEIRAIHHKECRRDNVHMAVTDDRPVDSLFFDSPEFSLICRADLLGVDSQSRVSPGVHLARLYKQQGDTFVRGLRGTFAIIVYDHGTGTLKAWTDHFGAEKLAFTNSNGFLAVATDLRFLLTLLRQQPTVDPAAIGQYLQFACIPAPKTIYKGISRLQPGHQLSSHPVTATRSYWDMKYESKVSRRPEAFWVKDTREAVRSAVARSVTGLDSARGLGCFLSGGTDSSSVAGLIGQHTAQPPRTFSIGFDHPRYNEIRYARIAAKRFAADHHEYFVKPADILALVQKAAAIYDEPYGNSSIIPTYFCARLAAENGVTHLLAGDGGDELFGGNSRYVEDRLFQQYSWIPGSIRRWLIEPVVSLGSTWSNLRFLKLAASYVRRSNLQPPDRYFSYSLISSVPAGDLFTGDFVETLDGDEPLAPARRHFTAASAQDELNRWLYLDLKIIITDNDLRKVSTMSRLAGVTPRYPLLDPTLAEFAGTIPVHLKVRGSQLRYLFKKAMADILPQEIINKSKHGFGLPYSVWLGENKPLRDFTFDVLGSMRCRERGYFHRDLLERVWSQYLSGNRAYHGEILWVFLMLELWHVTQFDNVVAPAPELIPMTR